MVSQLYPRTPKLQFGQQYDPWAAWKQGAADPYAPQTQLRGQGQAQPGQTVTVPGRPSAPTPTPITVPVFQQGQAQQPPNWAQWQQLPAAEVTYGGMKYQQQSTPPPATGPPETPTTGGAAPGSPETAQGGQTTTIDVNGQKVVLPIGWTGTPGPFRFAINGAQEDALTFLSRRLRGAQERGLNIQDPAIVYDEIARIRDDMLHAGVAEADLDRQSGIAGLSRFVRGQQPGTAPGTAPGSAPPPTAPGGAPPATVPPGPGAGPLGGGVFPSEVEMELARQSAPYAIAAYRKARGGGIDKSAAGSFREQMMGQATQAFLTMLGAGSDAGGNPVDMANQDMGQMMANLASGHGVGGLLRDQASKMLNQDLSGFDDTQLLNLFGAAQGAAGFGLGPFAQYALDNGYADMENLAQQNALGGGTTAALANPAARQQFMAELARYLAAR